MTSFVIKPFMGAMKRLRVALGIEARRATCKVCGRELRATASIERGMGAVCAGHKAKRDDKTIDMFAPTDGAFGGT